MLAAGLLAHALRGARQRGLSSGAVAAATAAWRLLQPAETGLPDASFSRVSSFGSSKFSLSAVSSSRGTASNAGSSSGGSDKGHRKRGRRTETSESQPQLQAWLQQQGLPAPDADQYARRLAHIFGSQQAALDCLPATFEWCHSRGLSGVQTAQLLDRIAYVRRESMVQFAALVQPVWQLLDSHIAAWVEQHQQAADAKLRKHSSLAEVLCSSKAAAKALGMSPGHVEAWLAAVGQRLPAAAIGRLLLSNPVVVTGSLSTAEAALDWAADELGVTDPAAFFGLAPALLKCNAPALQRNLDSLQQGLGCTAEQARRLALKQPVILGSSPDTVLRALAWLRQQFPDAEQLADVINRGPRLLSCSVQHLQGNADYLRQALGWQDGVGQLRAFLAAHPQDYATVNLGSEEAEHKLLLLSEVVGVSRQECLTGGISYINRSLEGIAARYMLVQERAPELLRNKAGELHLSWVINANKPHYLRRLGLTRPEFDAFARQWPASEEGRRLLEGLRAGSVEGWPRPPVSVEAEQQQQAEAARRTSAPAAMGAKRQGRGRGGRAQARGSTASG